MSFVKYFANEFPIPFIRIVVMNLTTAVLTVRVKGRLSNITSFYTPGPIPADRNEQNSLIEVQIKRAIRF